MVPERIIVAVFSTAEFLRLIAVFLALPGAFYFFRAIVRAKTSRTGAYYALRRQAANASNKDLASVGFIAIIATALALISIFLPPDITTPEPLKTLPISTIEAVVTFVPASVVMATPSPQAAVTATPILKVPLASQQEGFATAVRVTPSAKPNTVDAAGHKLVLQAISSAITPAGQPITPTTEFSVGVSSIYIVYDFSQMQQSLVIKQVWLRNGDSVYYDASTLKVPLAWSRTGTGSSYLVWTPKHGFDAGLYEVRVSIGDARQFSANFIVK